MAAHYIIPTPRRVSAATAYVATLLVERLLDILIDRGAMLISPDKGDEVVRMLHLATQGLVETSETDVSATQAAGTTWTSRGVTHTATLRVTHNPSARWEGYRLTLADHTSY